MVIGEFSSKKSSSLKDVGKELKYALDHGYAGAWDWMLLGGDGNDDLKSATKGMQTLKGNSKVVVDINQNMPAPEDTCSNNSCSDKAPDSTYSCAQQASWGKCDYDFMRGYCCKSCHDCNGCK